ncbi:MAG TPA: dihydrolipoamide acetyltransferase family protein, partial [Ktedonobacterales bacterium]|nr:dihydrolipoamide acetyltransferase family protein [Ktedonobacterales bacterium]
MMKRTVPMPKLGMTMTEGVLLRWHVAVGDKVAKDDVLAEVETDKVELEVESPTAGYIAQLFATEGQAVPVGEPLLEMDTEVAAPASEPVALSNSATPPVTDASTTPAVTTTAALTTATVVRDSHSPNGATPPRIPSTPAARRVAAERGVALVEVSEAMQVRGDIRPVREADVLAFAHNNTSDNRKVTFPALTPLARKLAEAHGLTPEDLAQVTPEPGRRIDRQAIEDLTAAQQVTPAVAQPAVFAVPASASASASANAPSVASDTNGEDIVALSSMRRIIAERTTHSFTTTPHIYLDTEVDMTEAEALRASYTARAQRANQPVPSATALLVRVCGIALQQHPEVNAGFVPARDGQPATIRRWHVAHVGVAVALPDGLLIPVIRNADRKSLQQITAELADLAVRARTGKLGPDELADGTFSISNLGMYGIDTFHAVINEPQAAILAVGRVTKRPVVWTNATGQDT